MKSRIYIGLAFLLALGVGCKKFVEVSPPNTSLSSATVFMSNSTAAAAVSGIYVNMFSNSIGGGSGGMSALMGVSADEFSLFPNSVNLQVSAAYANALQSTNAPTFWADLYNVIYQANAAIEGVSASPGVTAAMKAQLIGECEVIRAFCYFYLVNIYGDVPLITGSNYQENQLASRVSAASVYRQMITDLRDSQTRLGSNYLNAIGAKTTERVRPNAAVATALLARVYLYVDSMQNAETQATAVINNLMYNLPMNLNAVFSASSTEAIWQLEVPNNGGNTTDATVFLLNNFGGPSGNYPFILSDSIVGSFETGDLRRLNWVDSIIVAPGETYYFPYKYKLYYTGQPATEYPVLLRLAEQYLIRAEARVAQGELTAAAADLNYVRNRAGLSVTSASSQADLLAAIMRERKMELFTEYVQPVAGFETDGRVDSVMSIVTPAKGGIWKTSAQWFPIPILDVTDDPNLKQNAGYQ